MHAAGVATRTALAANTQSAKPAIFQVAIQVETQHLYVADETFKKINKKKHLTPLNLLSVRLSVRKNTCGPEGPF